VGGLRAVVEGGDEVVEGMDVVKKADEGRGDGAVVVGIGAWVVDWANACSVLEGGRGDESEGEMGDRLINGNIWDSRF